MKGERIRPEILHFYHPICHFKIVVMGIFIIMQSPRGCYGLCPGGPSVTSFTWFGETFLLKMPSHNDHQHYHNIYSFWRDHLHHHRWHLLWTIVSPAQCNHSHQNAVDHHWHRHHWTWHDHQHQHTSISRIKPVVVMLKCPRTEIGPSDEFPQSLPRSPVSIVVSIVFVFGIGIGIITIVIP